MAAPGGPGRAAGCPSREGRQVAPEPAHPRHAFPGRPAQTPLRGLQAVLSGAQLQSHPQGKIVPAEIFRCIPKETESYSEGSSSFSYPSTHASLPFFSQGNFQRSYHVMCKFLSIK